MAEENKSDIFQYEKNIHPQYDPTDLLNINTTYKLSAKERLLSAIRDIATVTQFRAKVIDDYYREVSCFSIKRNLRNALKVIILYYYMIIFMSFFQLTGDQLEMFLAALAIFLAIIIYMFTLRPRTHITYNIISIGLLILLFSVELYRAHIRYSDETPILMASDIQMVVVMYAFFPISLEACLSVGLIFSMGIELLRMDHRKKAGQQQLMSIPTASTSSVTESFVLWTAVHFVGIYLHIFSQLRCRATFLRLGENVKAEFSSKEAYRKQSQFIEAVMPSVIQNNYWKERKQNATNDMWVFCIPYDNVSILFSDIVGFTKMSSSKTATEVVTLLNELFEQMDELCIKTSCEKLGTLGDCYYCVAGCPTPRNDHAVCCVEMGLGVCRIISYFNERNALDVNMRVGIHTGRVNAAIIGNLRFRFDVYSLDVIVANQMETTGQPGRVHISETTYNLVKHLYPLEPGPPLMMMKESQEGIGGMKLKESEIMTYFLDPSSAKLTTDETYTISKKNNLNVIETTTTTLGESHQDSDFDSGACSVTSKSSEEKEKKQTGRLDADVFFVETLRRDPKRRILLLRYPPVRHFTLRFHNDDIEEAYHSTSTDCPMYVDSVQLAPFFDSVACLIFFFLIFLHSLFYQKYNTIQIIEAGGLLLLGLHTVILTGWGVFQVKSKLQSNSLKKLHSIVTDRRFRNLHAVVMCCLPSLLIMFLLFNSGKLKDAIFTRNMLNFYSVSLLAYAVHTSSEAVVNVGQFLVIGGIFITFSIFNKQYFFSVNNRANSSAENNESASHSCLEFYPFHWDSFNIEIYHFWITYFAYMIFLVWICRGNEKTIRLSFYASREAQRSRDEAEKAMLDCRELLYNIIPPYVLDQITAQGGCIARGGNFSYALALPDVGVVFACVSNFFSKYYRENYKGGMGALCLLNKIVCIFDNVLKDERFSSVEKIKTINDCYMVAAGLNPSGLSQEERQDLIHLRNLMYYCFEILDKLEEFNEEYIIGNDKFELKVGYNFGPVTAGILGTSKPMYDIWGDTVNVASRMYSTGVKGQIQVPLWVRDRLNRYFFFTFRGFENVKGKGKMETYTCQKRTASLYSFQLKQNLSQ